MNFRRLLVLSLFFTAVFAGPSCLGADEEKRDPELPRMTESQVIDEVEKAIPKWDKEILAAPAGPKWSARVGFGEVLKAVGETELKESAPKNARRVVDGHRVLRVIPERGTVRYVNRSLSWKPDQEAKLVDNEVALRTASNALDALGLPRAEMARPRVDTQGGHDASTTVPDDSRTYEMYRLVTVHRQIANLPVLGSRARVAIAGGGAIQRMRINWPTFTMPRGLRLRRPDAVAKEIIAQIMEQDPISLVGVAGSDLTKFVSTKLAYAPQEMTRPARPRPPGNGTEKPVDEKADAAPDADDKKIDGPVQFATDRKVSSPVLYLPVLLVTVAAGPTPYEIVVPVVESR